MASAAASFTLISCLTCILSVVVNGNKNHQSIELQVPSIYPPMNVISAKDYSPQTKVSENTNKSNIPAFCSINGKKTNLQLTR